jgi:hypothetical protein
MNKLFVTETHAFKFIIRNSRFWVGRDEGHRCWEGFLSHQVMVFVCKCVWNTPTLYLRKAGVPYRAPPPSP